MPTINVVLGQYSDLFMLLAAMVYASAFVAFAWDLAKSSKLIQEIDAQTVASEKKVLVAAGAIAPPPSGNPGNDLVNDSMAYTAASAKRMAAKVAVSLSWLGVLLQGFAVVARSIAAGRVPWGNMYEFLSTGAFLVALVFMLVLVKKDLRFMGTFVIGLVTVMLCGATLGFPTPVAHLVPALQSYWLVIHVSIAVLASSLFTITFAMNVLQLLQHARMDSLAAGKPDKMPFMRLVPGAAALENFAYRINAVAFVMWTFTLIAGAIWAEAAWGRYWGWDTKEVWTFVIWVVYAGYLHARATGGWTGARSAWLSIIGYLCIIFNFTVVNLYFNGLHSYAGV
ncbi:c-type cytochrome biogenesis protein CcsB [Paeniglutamicibacter gangotriensis]|uniref:C-type cytochrome biogenesis protein CcsB n=1 Tax=Paeniglutamicibacter gangotriensis TaxID=254787 RepID=A0A5B0E293_9MICC|nr:c-type cytochrome biogenesis protein CcsB [Paeniglutamicibacter gangotriensis]KAA0973134.1 c-type cytochrome biogenesis protein CcsB [Paeniglutamicibacter gangotriensis]